MTNRITTEMITGSMLNDINSSQAAMDRSQAELSSGKTILQASDNPYGASRAIALQSQLDGLGSYANNVQDGISWENTAGGALSNINDVAQRVRELLVQASSGIDNQSDLNNIATEVDQLTETVKQDANTQYAGQYIFSGTLTETPPYQPGATDAYQGDAGTVTRAIGPGSSVTVSTDISSLLGSGQGSGDGKLLDVLRTISEHLRGGTTEDKNALSSTDLKGIDANVATLTQLQAGAGAVDAQLQSAASRIEDLQNTTTQILSNTQDAELAKTSINYSNQQAAYDAALRAGANIVQMSLLEFLH